MLHSSYSKKRVQLQVRTLTFTSKKTAPKLENEETDLAHSYNHYHYQKSNKKTFNWLSNNNVKANFSKYDFFL